MTNERFPQLVSFLRFGASGVPGFVLAIGINVLAVDRFHWPRPLAYLLVMWVQMTIGFVMCRTLVFAANPEISVLHAYVQFALSMGIIRIADWMFYTGLVEIVKIPYVLAQISCTAVFLFIKFLSARAIFRPSSRPL